MRHSNPAINMVEPNKKCYGDSEKDLGACQSHIEKKD